MKITRLVVGLLGVLLVGLGGYLFVREQVFLQNAALSTATVTENVRHTYTGQVNESGAQHYYCTWFAFPTRTGQGASFSSCQSQLDSPPDYQVGQHVEVYYDPRDSSQTAQLRATLFVDYYAAALTATAAGALILGGLGVVTLVSRNATRPVPQKE